MSKKLISMNPKLDFWSRFPQQISSEDFQNICIFPTRAISEDTPLEFKIPGSTDYIDLNTIKIYTRVKIVKEDGTDMEEVDDNSVCFLNNASSSMWNNIEVKLSGCKIGSNTINYPLKSFVDILFQAQENAKNKLESLGWDPDINNNSEINFTNQNKFNPHSSFFRRAQKSNRSATIEWLSKPNIDFFNQSKDLLSQVDLEITCWPQRNDFLLIQRLETNYKYIIEEAYIIVKKIKMYPDLILSHEKSLGIAPAIYEFEQTAMKIDQISANQRTFTRDNIFNEFIPSKILIFMVRSNGYCGLKNTNALYLEHNNITSVKITKDGKEINQDIKIDINNQKLRVYETLLDFCDRSNSLEDGLIFKPSDLSRGLFLMGFDLSSDNDDKLVIPELKKGNISIKINFQNPLPHANELIIYAFFPTKIEITSSRNVIFPFIY